VLASVLASSSFLIAIQADGGSSIALTRKYAAGQKIAYVMHGINDDRYAKRRYDARVEGVVRQSPGGFFEEDFRWTDTAWGKDKTTYLPDDANSKQILSLDPYVPFGQPTSWADGNHVKIGTDSIDFDVTLSKVDRSKNIAVVVVRHVPPKTSKIDYPAEWMKDSDNGVPNNWIQVSRKAEGNWAAAFGKETFDVTLTVNLASGEIVRALEENVVEVTERECATDSLASPGPPIKYRIHRRITIQAVP
jgi:hypothetical protein